MLRLSLYYVVVVVECATVAALWWSRGYKIYKALGFGLLIGGLFASIGFAATYYAFGHPNRENIKRNKKMVLAKKEPSSTNL